MNSTNNDSGANLTNALYDNGGHTLFTLIALSLGNVLGIILGTIGNLLVILVVVFNREMRSPTNLFIANLSAADFLVTGICMPIFFVYNVIMWPTWPFGNATCRLVSYLVHVSVMASALNLLSISYDRFVSVYYPMKRVVTINRAKIIVASIWLLSLLLLMPSMFHHEVIDTNLNGKTVKMCTEKWNTEKQKHSYQMYRVSCYFLFLVQITVVYFLIGRRLQKRQLPGFQTTENKNKLVLQKRKVTKMLFLVVMCFALSWLPYITNKLLNIFPPSKTFKTPNVFVFVGNFLGLLNSCINPVLYAVLNHNFFKAFQNAIRCRWNYGVEERRRRISEPTIFQERKIEERQERRLSSLTSLHNNSTDVLQSSFNVTPEPVRGKSFRQLDINGSGITDSLKAAITQGTRRVSFSDAMAPAELQARKERVRKASSLGNIPEKPGDEKNELPLLTGKGGQLPQPGL